MKRFVSAAAALLFATAYATVEERDLCSDGSTDDNGNWYCQKVNAITYTGVGGSGTYNKISSMDSNSGSCSSSPFGYSGSMSPLDEEVSMHFRGPLNLKQFAFYAPGSSSSKKARRSATARRHAHAHAHAQHAHEKREAEADAQVGAIVTVTMDGQVVSWTNSYDGLATPAADSSSATSSAEATSAPVVNANYAAPASSEEASSTPASSSAAASPTSSSSSSSSSSDDSSSSSGSWGRQAYYNAESQTADGLVFLNHNGGSGSGVFDYTFGNSLSYAASDSTSGCSSPEVLSDTTIPSDSEIVIMTDKECTDDSCGFVRDGTVAYHGFDGASKAFFFEFGMPDDGQTSASKYDPVNMPAIWMLNAQIPRTLQYGNADCSCWTSGCGEFDIFEVLAPGDTRCKSTLHGNVQGGDSDYFERPTSGTIKAAVILNDNNMHIKILDDSYDIGSTLDQDTINDICESTLTQSKLNLVSLFSLSGK